MRAFRDLQRIKTNRKMIDFVLSIRRWTLAAVVASLTFQGVLAQTNRQDEALSDKLNRLERDLRNIQLELHSGSVGQSGGAVTQFDSPSAAARATLRMTEFDISIRRLTGQVEELGFRLDQIARQLEALSDDTDFRFRSLEEATGGLSLGIPNSTVQSLGTTQPSQLPIEGDEPTVAVIPQTDSVAVGERSFNTTVRTANAPRSLGTLPVTSVAPPRSAAEQYEAAKQRLMAGDFAAAEAAFTSFLEDHSDDELASEAQYWLGEAFYVRGAYQEAGRIFADGLAKYPNSVKGPNILLKLGMSLSALNQIDDACATFGELDRRYPDASKTIVQRVKVELAKAGC